jgi:hypothetical protein
VFPYQLRGSRPVLSCENGREGVSGKFLRPTDRSQNFGRTKLLSDSETVGRALNFGRTKSIIESSIFHTKERAVNRVESISQNLFKFYCHFLGRRARGVFSVPLAFRKSF